MILILNVGSSSVKTKIFDDQKEIYSQNFENITNEKQRLSCLNKIKKYISSNDLHIHKVGHRVVHGKEFTKPLLLNDKNIEKISKISDLAPLHVRAELAIVKLAKEIFKVKHYAVFDTAFHSTMPIENKIYAIPYKYYEKGIHKYGFHGTSHKYVTKGEKGKIVSCHLGSGCSLAAIKNGKSIDTTMGFTPLDGLVMSTRAGSIDPGLFSYLAHYEKKSVDQLTDMFNKKSGLLGISKESNDMKTLLDSKSKNSKLAVNVFCHSAAQHIAKMIVSLNGIDTIIFTGGMGEKSAPVRKKIIDKLSYFNVEINEAKNKQNAQIISSPSSKINVKIKETNEELQIANEIK